MVSMKLVDCEETTCALVMVALFIQTVEIRALMLKLSVKSQKLNKSVVLLATSIRRHRRSNFEIIVYSAVSLLNIPANKRGNDVFPVRTSDFQATFMQVCTERNDTWAHAIRGRIEFAQDLHAADAIYSTTKCVV